MRSHAKVPGTCQKAIEIPYPIKVDRLTRVVRVKGVDIYIHWTVFLIAALMLVNSVRRPVLTLVAIVAYFSVLLIHECGHLIAAHWRGSEPLYIEIYPVHGFACFETPYSRFDHCIIAWGGVLAQLVVAIPLVAWVAIFGYTRFDAINAVLAMLGGFSLVVAILNLLPVWRLDGTIAWGIIPAWIARRRSRRNSRAAAWRAYR